MNQFLAFKYFSLKQNLGETHFLQSKSVEFAILLEGEGCACINISNVQ